MYKINTVDIRTLGGTVTEIQGVLSMAERLGETFKDWGDVDGVEPYVLADDIAYNGRLITLSIIVESDPLETAVNNIVAACAGTFTLETPYGSIDVSLMKFEHDKWKDNNMGMFTLKLWEETPAVIEPDAMIAGTGTKIDGYDLYNNFGIVTGSIKGHLSKGVLRPDKGTLYLEPVKFTTYRGIRGVSLDCAAKYADSATMGSQIKKFQSLMGAPGLRSLLIPTNSGNVVHYCFLDRGFSVNIFPGLNFCTFNVKLKVV